MPPVKEPRKSEKESVDRVEIHMRILTGMNIVYEKKNHDYGDSFAQVRKNIPNAILVRLWDKLNRLTTLLQGAESQISDETIDDTLIDLANYAVMELVEREIDKNV